MLEEIDGLLRLVDAGGTIAILLLGLYLGLSGRVVPIHLVEKIVAQVVEEVIDELEQRGRL